MTTYVVIGGVLLAITLVASFAVWLGNKSAAAAGVSAAKAAQASAEAGANKAALGVAVQGEDDADVVKSLRDGTF